MNVLTTLLRALASSAPPALPAVSNHVEFLDYADKESRRTLDDLRTAFNAHFERALKVLTLLTGGAGAVVAYTVNNWAQLNPAAQWALLSLALGWSAIAAYLAIWGMRSRQLGSGPKLIAMAAIYTQHAGSATEERPAAAAENALLSVRRAELNRLHLQIQAYAKAVGQQTSDLRLAVVLAALSPALAIATWALAMRVTQF